MAVGHKRQQQLETHPAPPQATVAAAVAAEHAVRNARSEEQAAASARLPAMPSTYQHSMRAVTAAAQNAMASDTSSLHNTHMAANEVVAIPLQALHLPGVSAPAASTAAHVPQQRIGTGEGAQPESGKGTGKVCLKACIPARHIHGLHSLPSHSISLQSCSCFDARCFYLPVHRECLSAAGS